MKTAIVLAVMLMAGMNAGAIYAQSVSPQVEETLNNLIATSIDAQKSYSHAAQVVVLQKLKDRFNSEAFRRAKFAAALKARAWEEGKIYRTVDDLAVYTYTGWIDTKAAVQRRDDRAVLDSLKTGERGALKAYHDALARPLPKHIEELVKIQKNEIQSAYDHLDTAFQDDHGRK